MHRPGAEHQKTSESNQGHSTAPDPGKLVTGLIHARHIPLEEIISELEWTFCKVEMLSDTRPFSWTSYYTREMGKRLDRVFVAFNCLVEQDSLVDVKEAAIGLEEKWKEAGNRRVNIDPGIITAERLVLATTKNFTHRIYLQRGIYADLTLIFQKGGFRPLEWTYPDYREEWSLEFWDKVRKQYMGQLRAENARQLTLGETHA